MSAENSKPLQWFRWHHGTYNDPKWMTVALRANSALAAASPNVTPDHTESQKITVGHVVSIWAAMMENASMANPRGELDGWDDEDVGAFLGYTAEQVGAIRGAMQGKTLDGNKLTAWPKRQPKREDPSAAARQQAKRERDKGDVTDGDNNRSHDVSRSDTQSHPREEERREEKKDQKQSSLRSDSSSTASTTGGENVIGFDQRAEERLAQVTEDAINAFNATLARPNGLLARVSDKVGKKTRRNQVRRCLEVAREICEMQYSSKKIVPKFWDDYCQAVKADPFKAGRSQGGRGHETWTPKFEYIMRPQTILDVFDSASSPPAEGQA